VEALRALPVSALLEAQGGRDALSTGARGFAPVLDGTVIPMHPVQALERGAAPDVPLLIGTNFDEATLFLGADPALADPSKLSFDDLPERLRMYGDRAAPLIAAYRVSRPEATPLDILLAINTDAMMRVPSIKLAEKKLVGPGKTPVFMYLFCWSVGPLRSGHGFELAFMFDNVRDGVMHPSPSRQQLADRMSEAWLAFAKTGDPSHDGLPRWRPYDTETRATMIFDRGQCEVRDDPWGAERAAWVR
jgi:para-nitrobenzyl esterase